MLLTAYYATGDDDCTPSSSMATMEAKLVELRAWQSTGIYTWQEMGDMIAAITRLASIASSAAVNFFAGPSTPVDKSAVRRAADKYFEIAKRVHEYIEAKNAGYAQKRLIAAPGFRQWVIDDLQAALELLRTVEHAVCNQPWWLTSVVAAAAFFIDVTDVAKRIGKAVLKLGEAAVDAAESAGSIAAFLLRAAPFAAVGVGGYVLYRYAKKRR